MPPKKCVYVLGGGTISHVRSHLALCAPAFGQTAATLNHLAAANCPNMEVITLLTAMGESQYSKCGHRPNDYTQAAYCKAALSDRGIKHIVSNDDVAEVLCHINHDLNAKIVFMSVAMCDFDGNIVDEEDTRASFATLSGKYAQRLSSRNSASTCPTAPPLEQFSDPKTNQPLFRQRRDAGRQVAYTMQLTPAHKVIGLIRNGGKYPMVEGPAREFMPRKDIFLVGFKTTTGASEHEQYLAGLKLCKEASCNLVLANDVVTRLNMIITPEEARYHVSADRDLVLRNLVDMADLRSQLTFTRSTVVAGEPIPWDSKLVPASLRTVVDHCIAAGAYKPFAGATVGHFAVKLDEKTFLTSRRKTDFNKLREVGLVKIETDGPDSVIAYGSKPSVGGQSQRIVFHDHTEYDAICHFHCPIRSFSEVPTVSQREVECGSHECGRNTSNNLRQFAFVEGRWTPLRMPTKKLDEGIPVLSAVYLDQHGPNVVFHHSIDPKLVIRFIEENFDLTQKTGGPVA